MIGIIGGTSLLKADIMWGARDRTVKNKFGSVYLFEGKDFIFIPRHGKGRTIPPHMINHKANILALQELECEFIIGINSVGSLKKKIRPGSILIPDDYINPWNIQTYYDTTIVHITPALDDSLRKLILRTAKSQGIDVIGKGIYLQTIGPRLETKAEVKFFQGIADVVGMTMASEATLSRELNLQYASICTVDNFCHGIFEEPLDFEKVVEEVSEDRNNLMKLITAVIKELNRE
ncbi:MAG TPA: 6-oxopurine nucleoside phosphorylase [Candidatus Altiarchaeales archaeon]|nr:6-oxopurine nucleoside phosphorylase [Candidatus Altiarchaeales archaeon]